MRACWRPQVCRSQNHLLLQHHPSWRSQWERQMKEHRSQRILVRVSFESVLGKSRLEPTKFGETCTAINSSVYGTRGKYIYYILVHDNGRRLRSHPGGGLAGRSQRSVLEEYLRLWDVLHTAHFMTKPDPSCCPAKCLCATICEQK